MKQHEAVKAYKALINLGQEKLPFDVAYALYQKKKELQDVFDFQVEQEKKLIEQYHASIDEKGFFHTENPVHMPLLQKELAELRECKTNKIIQQIEIKIPDDLKISIDELEPLLPIIKFVRE
jgi:hypothetical protein